MNLKFFFVVFALLFAFSATSASRDNNKDARDRAQEQRVNCEGSLVWKQHSFLKSEFHAFVGLCGSRWAHSARRAWKGSCGWTSIVRGKATPSCSQPNGKYLDLLLHYQALTNAIWRYSFRNDFNWMNARCSTEALGDSFWIKSKMACFFGQKDKIFDNKSSTVWK